MEKVKNLIRDVKDFPKPGIIFKDITPILNDPIAFKAVIDEFVKSIGKKKIDRIVGIESRGFIFGAPLAERLGAGFVPARKPGKLPSKTIKESFALEYGKDCLELHKDSINPGESVIIIDDLLATGGTMEAAVKLVTRLEGKIEKILFLIELSFLHGNKKLLINGKAIPYKALITY